METLVVRNTLAYLFLPSLLKVNYHFYKDCRDGDILLYDGYTLSSDHSNGTVLVCLNNVYGTVCDDFWNPLDATVVCTQLGFSTNGRHYFLSLVSFYFLSINLLDSIPVLHSDLGSPPNRSIIMDNVVCSGGERNLTECDYSTINNCDRSEEAGVRCECM